jgi:predicted deacetylase
MSLLDASARAATAPTLTTPSTQGRLAVALHDVEPRTFARCKQIREWLYRRGVERVTLLVIPAADLHPIGARAPALAAWLRCRVARGDAVAQHGLVHRAQVRARWPRSVIANWQGGEAAEFPGLNREQTVRRVRTGRRLLLELELDPIGFVAPGYAYTRALKDELAETFEWFADLRGVSVRSGERRRIKSPALCLGSSTALKRALSPAIVRVAARAPGPVMRVDIHPADFGLPAHVSALEALLGLATDRGVITYDELLAPDRREPQDDG